MKKYAKTHEWVEVNEKIATIGISDHAQNELGDIVYVDLPEIGKEVKAGEVLCSLESVKSASDLYAPVSGKVVEVNESLEDAPETINKSAESDGWIVKVEISNESELDALMDEKEYEEFIKE